MSALAEYAFHMWSWDEDNVGNIETEGVVNKVCWAAESEVGRRWRRWGGLWVSSGQGRAYSVSPVCGRNPKSNNGG